MAKRRIASALTLVAVLLMGGCNFGQSARHWPTYVGLTHSILETELSAGLVLLDDVEVIDRQRIMERLIPVLQDTVDLAERYKEDLDDEMGRRGL